jgi:hypothetical protein
VSAYNQYMRCSNDAGYVAALENYQMLVRPLFITSFMLADFLEDNGFFGARQVVVSCASSKTAFGTAFCLDKREGLQLIAATSAWQPGVRGRPGLLRPHLELRRDHIAAGRRATLYVDFSGNDDLPRHHHHHFGDALVYDCYAGSAQKTEFLGNTDALPGPTPQLYLCARADPQTECRLGAGGGQPPLQRSAEPLHRRAEPTRQPLDDAGARRRLRACAGGDREPARGQGRPARGARHRDRAELRARSARHSALRGHGRGAAFIGAP